MEYVYILSEDEKFIIDSSRARESRQQERLMAQETCIHVWRYICACHNDDAYECTKCGKSEYF